MNSDLKKSDKFNHVSYEMWNHVNWSIDIDNKEQNAASNFKEKCKNRKRVRERG